MIIIIIKLIFVIPRKRCSCISFYFVDAKKKTLIEKITIKKSNEQSLRATKIGMMILKTYKFELMNCRGSPEKIYNSARNFEIDETTKIQNMEFLIIFIFVRNLLNIYGYYAIKYYLKAHI